MSLARTAALLTSIAAVWFAGLGGLHAGQPTLDPHLEGLRPLLEKTWKGTFKNSNPEKPTVDIARWERALNGRAVRMTHSINQGLYGGECIFVWDEKKQAVTYYYFTTAQFMSTGTIEVKDGKFLSREEIAGDAGGTTAVRGTSEIMPDGTFHVKTEHLKNGRWEPGHEVTYQPDNSAHVVFK